MKPRARLAAPFIVLALTVAGCGGGQVTVKEVPGAPVQLTTPGGAGLAPTATPTATASATATVTPTATTTGAASGTTTGQATAPQQTASTTTTTGSTSGDPQPAATATPTATPPPGSPTQQYEDFCAQNPGAC